MLWSPLRSTWRLCKRQLRLQGQVDRINLRPRPTAVLFYLLLLLLLRRRQQQMRLLRLLHLLLLRLLRWWMLIFPFADRYEVYQFIILGVCSDMLMCWDHVFKSSVTITSDSTSVRDVSLDCMECIRLYVLRIS